MNLKMVNSSTAHLENPNPLNATILIGHDQDEMSIEKTFSIIVQCFGLIIIGYLFGRLNIITQEQSKGISAFTSRIALIFISLVEIKFSSVNWTFIFLIFLAKSVIFILVTIATLVITKPSNLGLAAIYSIFCTQGNDFAFGYPILSMLYGPAQKIFLDYLYILAPIQLLVLNPLGSVMLEVHNIMQAKGKDKKQSNLIVSLLKNLFYNPINLMTFVGIVWNLTIGNQVPEIIYFFLDTAAKSFSATALFLLGFNMTGRFKQFKNTKKLLLPLTLVGLKIIISPLINRLFVERGLKNESAACVEEYSSFSFLYGAIPTAPTAFIYALDYGLKADLVASAMVICTVLSSPLMFVSANLVRSAYNKMNYKEDLAKFLNQLSIISLPCIIWVLFLLIVSKKYKLLTHRCTMVILIAQLGMSTSNYLGNLIKDKQNEYVYTYHFQYLLSVCSVFLLRIWTAVLAITIAFLQYRGLCFVLKMSKIVFVLAMVTTLGLFGVVIMFPNYPVDEFDPNFEFGCLQAKISAGLIFITLIITIVSIVMHHRNSPYTKQRTTGRYSQLSNSDRDEDVVNSAQMMANEHSNVQISVEESSDDESHRAPVVLSQQSVQVLDVEDLISEGFEAHCDTRFNCSKKQKQACQQIFDDYRESVLDAVEAQEQNEDIVNLKFYQKHQIFLHVVFLLTTILSMLIALEVCISKLLFEQPTGILIELLYLDVLMNHGLGIILFIQFGFNIEPLIAIFSKRKLKVSLPKRLNYETKLVCTNFKENYLDKCKSEILFQLNDRNEFCYVFRGKSLVDWLINEGLADSRKEGELFSKKLLEGRIIEHITNEQYFQDTTYLYKFNYYYSNKILDLRQSVGLSNLPNNATLTIKPITKARNQAVTVCVQLEGTGEKQIGEFVNNQSLWEIVGTLFPEKILDPISEISCLYMRTEVSGAEKLQETRLSSLGILSGKVAIKLKIANPNEESASRKSSEQSKLSKFTKELNQNMSDKVSSLQTSIASKLEILKKKMAAKKKNSPENISTSNVLEAESGHPDYQIIDELIEFDVVGRKVVLFSQDDKQRLTGNQEVSDDFFEITRDDVRIMYSDLQKAKTTVEDRPLETQKLREQRLSKEAKKYEFTIIRLSFPFDHLVLQTTFNPSDTIEELIHLTTQFVNVTDFYLYTAPPKKVLDNKSTFVKEKLVPAALIQFGGHQTNVLKDEYKRQVSSFVNVAGYTTSLRERLKNNSEQKNESQQTSNAAERAKKEERLKNLLLKK